MIVAASSQSDHDMKISIVTTLYRSETFIQEFYNRARQAAEELGADYEFIFVNDGSPDSSLAVALDVCRRDANVKVFDLAKNFGHHPAIMVGLRAASGDYVFLIDVDLEEAPENLVTFFQDLVSSPDTDVIYGVWRRHGEPWGRKLAADAYYSAFNLLSDTSLPRNLVLARLMTRRYVDALMESWNWGVPPAPLMASIGFVQRSRDIQRTYKGYTSYSTFRRIKILVDSVTSFSARPLQYIFLVGLAVSALSALFTLYAVVGYLSVGQPVHGWYSVFVSIWFIGGLAMMSMGVLGLYIAKIFDQVKGRPVAIVRRQYDQRDLLSPTDEEVAVKVATVSDRR